MNEINFSKFLFLNLKQNRIKSNLKMDIKELIEGYIDEYIEEQKNNVFLNIILNSIDLKKVKEEFLTKECKYSVILNGKVFWVMPEWVIW